MCELNRDVDIKFVSVDDASNDDITCTFKELPGASWTSHAVSKTSGYIKGVIDKVP